MSDHQFSSAITTPTGILTSPQKTYTADMIIEADVAVADAATDLLVAMNLDVSQLISVFLFSNYQVTLETNNGTTPDDTLVLKENIAYNWNTDSYDTLKLTTDVTAFYFTNASGSNATVKYRFLVDPTI